MSESFVYVIGEDEGPQKVGMSISPEARRRTLGRRFRVHHTVPVAKMEARKVEQFAHFLLRDAHEKNEWFNVDPSAALDAINEARDAVRRGEEPPFNFRNPNPMTERLVIGCDGTFIEAIDNWRRDKRPIPNRSEAIRTIVQIALEEAKLWPK